MGKTKVFNQKKKKKKNLVCSLIKYLIKIYTKNGSY